MNKRRLYESIMQNVAKKVKRALYEYEYSSGWVPNDGNGMVGGSWASGRCTGTCDIYSDFMDKFYDLAEDYIDEAELEKFEQYCYDNIDVFELTASILWSYDHSVGIDDTEYEMDEITNEEEIRDFVQEYDFKDEQSRDYALQALSDVIAKLDIEDFDIKDDMYYEPDYDD